MSKHHVVSFYQIEKILDHERLSRDVMRFATKYSLLGTFFSTPHGKNDGRAGAASTGVERSIRFEHSMRLERSMRLECSMRLGRSTIYAFFNSDSNTIQLLKFNSDSN